MTQACAGGGGLGLVESLRNRPTCKARLKSRTIGSSGMHHIASSCTSYMHVYLATRGCRCSLGTRPTAHEKVVRPRPEQPERRRCLCPRSSLDPRHFWPCKKDLGSRLSQVFVTIQFLVPDSVQKQKEEEILSHAQQETMPNKESQSPFYLKTLSFEGSVNTTCSVDLRLIDARFVNYNSQALPPSVYSLCT